MCYLVLILYGGGGLLHIDHKFCSGGGMIFKVFNMLGECPLPRPDPLPGIVDNMCIILNFYMLTMQPIYVAYECKLISNKYLYGRNSF